MNLQIFVAGAVALLISFISVPIIKRRIALRIASYRRNTGSPRRIGSKDPVFNFDLVLADARNRKAGRGVKMICNFFSDLDAKTVEHFPFGARKLFTMDARNVQFLAATEAGKFGTAKGRIETVEMIGKGIMNTDDDAWLKSRKLITPTFTRTHIADREFFENHFERFLAQLPQHDQTVDLKPYFDQLILDASSEFIFGESFHSQLGGEKSIAGKKFLAAFMEAQFVVGTRLAFGRLLASLLLDKKFKKFKQNCKILRSYTLQHIDRALYRQSSAETATKKEEPYILVHEIVKQMSNKNAICDQLLNVFMAGRDAPAVALHNIMFSVVRHPAVWARMKEETKGLKPSDLTFEKTKSLRYIQYVINEGLRLYPALPILARTCMDQTELPYGGGPNGDLPVTVMPGDTVSFIIYAMHRNPDVFGPDVEDFRPERWQDIRPGWNYLPFGGGARHCPAQQLGLFWVAYALVRLVTEFKEIQNMEPVAEFVEDLKLNCENRNGLKVRLVRE